MTIATRDVNKLGPGKFRTSPDNGEEQTCYFNRNQSDTHFTCFSAKRTQAKPITVSIVKLNSDFELVNKSLEVDLKNSVSNGQLKGQLQQVSSENFNNGKYYPRLQSQPMYDNDNMEDLEATQESSQQLSPERNQDISQQQIPAESKFVSKRKIRYTATRIKYSSTRIKSRNFLSNISYTGISKNDFYNENFILDVYVLLVKNLNPFSMSRKVTDKTKHEMVYMLWRERVTSEFYRYICEEKNFIYLDG